MTERARTLVAGLVPALAAVVIALAFRDLRHDDAFITFQYARHLALGDGWVFNPGERILGTTSPLHAMLLALLHPLVGDALPVASIWLGALGLGLAAFALHRLLVERSALLSVAIPLLVLAGLSHPFTWLSLETCLLAGLVLSTFAAVDAGRSVLAGVLLGLSFLCRYDAALFVPVVAWLDFRKHRGIPKRLLLVSFVVVAPWLLFATAYFGSFLPQTFFSKRGLTAPGTYLGHYVGLFTAELFGADRTWTRVLGLAAWVAGVAWALRRAPVFGIALLSGLLHLLAYAWIGPPEVQHWHGQFAELMFVTGVVASSGWFVDSGPSGRIVGVVAASVILVVTLVRTSAEPAEQRTNPWLGGRQADYEEVARVVARVAPGDSPFMAAEVGTLGWLTKRPMVDPFGLVGETNDFPLTGALEDWLDLMQRTKPGVMLVDSERIAGRIAELTPYRIVAKVPRGVLMVPTETMR